MGTNVSPTTKRPRVSQVAAGVIEHELANRKFVILNSRGVEVPVSDDDQLLTNIVEQFNEVIRTQFTPLRISHLHGAGEKWLYPTAHPESDHYALHLTSGLGMDISYGSVWSSHGSLRPHSIVVSVTPDPVLNSVGVILRRPTIEPYLMSVAFVTLDRQNRLRFWLSSVELRVRDLADSIFPPMPQDHQSVKAVDETKPQREPVYIEDYQLRELTKDVNSVLFPRAAQTIRSELESLPVFLRELAADINKKLADSRKGYDLD